MFDFNITTAPCLTPCATNDSDDKSKNPPECEDPLFAADNPTICTDNNGNVVTIEGLRIVPTEATVEVGKTSPFRAYLDFSDGRVKDMTDTVVWSTGNGTVASIAQVTGYATGLSEGSTTVTAVFRTYFAFAQLNVEAECISLPVDFAVVIDRSGSMDAVGPDGRTRMESALIATQAFIANVNYSKDQVALISFSGTLDDIQQPTVRECNNTIHTTLTDVQSDVESALASVGIVKPCDVTDATTGRHKLTCLTYIGCALQAAYDELTSVRARADARKCCILLSDGGNNSCSIDPQDVADQMKAENFAVAVIALAVPEDEIGYRCGGGNDLLLTIMEGYTNCSLFWNVQDVDELGSVYAAIPTTICKGDTSPCWYAAP